MIIGIIHATCNAVPPLNDAFIDKDNEVTVLNFVDESIQFYANKVNKIDDKIYRSFVNLALTAQDAGVDAIVIACTVLTPIIDYIRPLIKVPVTAVDYPMLEYAMQTYEKIGVVVTTAPSGPATKSQLEALAQKNNKNIKIKVETSTKAMDELKRGNVERHNELNRIVASNLKSDGCEVIILAQVTQAIAKSKVE